MTAALGLSLDDSIEMFIHRRIERSLGTSFGDTIEKFLAILLGGKRGKDLSKDKDKTWMRWWDIIIDREYREYREPKNGKGEKEEKKYKGIVLAVKSSSANVNKDIVEMFIQHAREAEEKGYWPFLVFTYGKKVWSVVKPTMKAHKMKASDYVVIGRNVYKKFLRDYQNAQKKDYYDYIIEKMVTEISAEDLELSKAIDEKKKELLEELKKRYESNDVLKLLKDLS